MAGKKAVKKETKKAVKKTTVKLPNIPAKKGSGLENGTKSSKNNKKVPALKHKLLTENDPSTADHESKDESASQQDFLLPTNYLVSLYGKPIEVHLKFNDAVYKGILLSIDEYFNLRLENTVEFIKEKETGKIGDCFIRCNTVLMISHK